MSQSRSICDLGVAYQARAFQCRVLDCSPLIADSVILSHSVEPTWGLTLFSSFMICPRAFRTVVSCKFMKEEILSHCLPFRCRHKRMSGKTAKLFHPQLVRSFCRDFWLQGPCNLSRKSCCYSCHAIAYYHLPRNHLHQPRSHFRACCLDKIALDRSYTASVTQLAVLQCSCLVRGKASLHYESC